MKEWAVDQKGRFYERRIEDDCKHVQNADLIQRQSSCAKYFHNDPNETAENHFGHEGTVNRYNFSNLNKDKGKETK